MTIGWREFVFGVVIAIVLAISSLARAQDAEVQPLPEPEVPHLELGDFAPLRRGQSAPSDGLLVAADVLLSIQRDYDALAYRLTRERERAEERCGVQLDVERARTRAAQETTALHDGLWEGRQRELIEQVRQAQRAAERQPWESPALWAGVGALVASLVAILVAQL